ncbi:MAG: metallophosphoesterase [Prevotella sp.]|nr:metallophosphoesterase [Prevotella sp.]
MMQKKLIRRFFILTILLISCISASADKKIFLLADPHVMSPELLDSPDNEAWQAYLAGSKKMIDLSVPVFNKLCSQILAEKPDLVLIAGDLTKDAEKASHEYVINKLTEIEAAGIPVFIIPGNHDRGWQADAKVYQDNTTTDASCLSSKRLPGHYTAFGYGEGSELHGTDLTYAAEVLPGLILIAIDSEQTAVVDLDAMNWAFEKAKEARSKGKQVVTMMHHALLPHINYQELLFTNSVIDNNEYLRDKLMEAGVKVMLTGHYHVSDITRYTNSQGQEIYDVCTGSPISYPCDYRILTFSDDLTTLKISTKSITEIDEVPDFKNYAKERLRRAVQIQAAKRADFSDSGFINDLAARLVADIFIIHAEGNEPQSDNSANYSQLAAIAPDIFNEIIQSMMGDYSTPEEKDNVVDDRELTITMPVLPTAIRQIPTESSDAHTVWYTLQGVRLNSAPTVPGIYLQNGRKIVVTSH